MTETTVFQSGNSQAVRLPKEFRFKSKTVQIFRHGDEVVVREKPRTLGYVLAALPPTTDEDAARLDDMLAIIREPQPQQEHRTDGRLSVVTEAEIRYGQACRPVSGPLAARIDALLGELRRLPLGPCAVAPYARLRAGQLRAGMPIGPNDLTLAAQALAEDLTLVSGNEREFARVPGLRIENWLR
jgi:predicted nucleic acid-binding protein